MLVFHTNFHDNIAEVSLCYIICSLRVLEGILTEILKITINNLHFSTLLHKFVLILINSMH